MKHSFPSPVDPGSDVEQHLEFPANDLEAQLVYLQASAFQFVPNALAITEVSTAKHVAVNEAFY